jgi:hypothetical protein
MQSSGDEQFRSEQCAERYYEQVLGNELDSGEALLAGGEET